MIKYFVPYDHAVVFSISITGLNHAHGRFQASQKSTQGRVCPEGVNPTQGRFYAKIPAYFLTWSRF